jgi:hypothetical protein
MDAAPELYKGEQAKFCIYAQYPILSAKYGDILKMILFVNIQFSWQRTTDHVPMMTSVY